MLLELCNKLQLPPIHTDFTHLFLLPSQQDHFNSICILVQACYFFTSSFSLSTSWCSFDKPSNPFFYPPQKIELTLLPNPLFSHWKSKRMYYSSVFHHYQFKIISFLHPLLLHKLYYYHNTFSNTIILSHSLLLLL